MDFRSLHVYFTFKSECKLSQFMDSSAPNSMLMDPYTAGMNYNPFILAPGTVMHYDCVYMHRTSFHFHTFDI